MGDEQAQERFYSEASQRTPLYDEEDAFQSMKEYTIWDIYDREDGSFLCETQSKESETIILNALNTHQKGVPE